MRILLGLLTVAAGSAAVVAWYNPDAAEGTLAVVTDVNSGGVAKIAVPAPDRATRDGADSGGQRFFGFALPSAVPSSRSPADKAAGDPPASGKRVAEKAWSTEVVVYPDGRDSSVVVPASAPSLVVAPRLAAMPRERPRQELVAELQRELRRVGCYLGEIDGEWGPGSKRSMRAFMDHVNSRLQSDDPDLIQLTLVRGFPGNACRSQAAPGQMIAGRGSAPAPVPVMVRESALPIYTATSSRPAQFQTGTLEPAAQSVVRPPLPEGRMAVGGPVPPVGQPAAGASLNGGPVAAPARAQRPRPQGQNRAASAPARRTERNWTRNFFDQ